MAFPWSWVRGKGRVEINFFSSLDGFMVLFVFFVFLLNN